MNELKKVVLTGATGCIGRNILDQLILHPSEPDIYILHRRNANLQRLFDVNYNKLHFCVIDVDDYGSFLSAIPMSADALIHAAGNTSFNKKDKEQQYKDNVILTDQLLAASLFNGVEKFVFTSTAATHSTINSSYVNSKKTAEKLVWKACRSGLNATILQPAIVIGKHDYNSYFHIFKGISDKTITRSFGGSMEFCGVTNVAKAHIRAITASSNSNFILGGHYTTWQTLFKVIHTMLCSSNSIKDEEPSYKPYNKYWLKFLSYLESFKKNPRITPEIVNLLSSGVELRETEKTHSYEYLDYKNHLVDLIGDIYANIEWLKGRGLI